MRDPLIHVFSPEGASVSVILDRFRLLLHPSPAHPTVHVDRPPPQKRSGTIDLSPFLRVSEIAMRRLFFGILIIRVRYFVLFHSFAAVSGMWVKDRVKTVTMPSA